MADFDVLKMSVAEIIFVTGLCNDANGYLKHGHDLRTAWKELKNNPSDYKQFLTICGIECNDIEGAFPEEFYDDIAQWFDPKKMPLDAIRKIVDGIDEWKTDHLKKKYQDNQTFEEEFERFVKTLNEFVNRKAVSRSIASWEKK